MKYFLILAVSILILLREGAEAFTASTSVVDLGAVAFTNTEIGTATASANAATLDKQSGRITR